MEAQLFRQHLHPERSESIEQAQMCFLVVVATELFSLHQFYNGILSIALGSRSLTLALVPAILWDIQYSVVVVNFLI